MSPLKNSREAWGWMHAVGGEQDMTEEYREVQVVVKMHKKPRSVLERGLKLSVVTDYRPLMPEQLAIASSLQRL